MLDSRNSDSETTKRDIPSFIEPRPPLILNPFMRPRPQKGTNLMDLFEDSEYEEPDLVQVYLRLKPCNIPSKLYEVRSNRCLITSLDTTTAGHGRRTQHNVSKMYTFSHIFGPESTQKEIFENVVKDNLKKLPDGNSFTLLAYGASGSGKTFTLMGTVASPGLVPRSLEYVFKVVDAAQQPVYKPDERGAERLNHAQQEYELQWVQRLRQVSAPLRDKYRRMSIQLENDFTSSNTDLSNRRRHYVWVSFIEIYNEGIYDLLALGDRRNASKLAIREDTSGNVYVKGATQAFVKSGEEAYDIMAAGKHNLQVAATGIHAQSSRSHCIFTITMLTETENGTRTACVRLCDLAGCERAARTRNVGARMNESRAINSSLHVLERCLRMLRRKRTAAAVVPYRESKLTRLLGAGLSGTRGEAVSMVVTLNPSPHYANETKHVLQLAAVAKDIQINSTISDYPSSLESSAQDTTIGYSSEVLKLRSDNERLHFELVQAQARNNELLACMEEKQAANAETMRELVEEAKEITKQYYETQMEALRQEIDEMAEENETNSRSMQRKIDELLTEITILEENLSAERLARARAEEEVQHLRACIDERDEKSDEELANNDDVVDLSESDNSDVENDPRNESLEPTFKKEDINRSRMTIQSIIKEQRSFISEHSDDSVLEKSNDTLKDNTSDIESNNCTYETGNDTYSVVDDIKVNNCNSNTDDNYKDNESVESSYAHSITQNNDKTFKKSSLQSNDSNDDDKEKLNEFSNRTYGSINDNSNSKENKDSIIRKSQSPLKSFDLQAKNLKETYSISDDNCNKNTDNCNSQSLQPLSRETYCVTNSESSNDLNNVQLPTCELDIKDNTVNEREDIVPTKVTNTFVNKLITTMKNSSESNSSLVQFERLEMAMACGSTSKKSTNEVFSNIKIFKEKRNYFDEQSDDKQLKTPDTVIKAKERKIFFDNNNTKEKIEDKNEEIIPSTAMLLKEKKIYFEDCYETNKNHSEILNKNEADSHESLSFMREENKNDSEPNILKKVLVQNISKQKENGNINEIKIPEVDNSIDMFEDMDSPKISCKITHDIPSHVLENKQKPKQDIIDAKCTQFKVETESEVITELRSEQDSVISSDKIISDISSLVNDKNAQEKDIVLSPKILLADVKSKNILDPQDKLKENHTSVSDKEKSSLNTCEVLTNDKSQLESSVMKTNNTLMEFENIYKDVTMPRATEFDLLVTQEIKDSTFEESNKILELEKLNYNLRSKSKPETERKTRKKDVSEGQILMESNYKCESKSKTKRSLRLRRQKPVPEDNPDLEKENKKKDIVTLQTEFSDVTLDLPTKPKSVKDIPSPEKVENDENSPPIVGLQSCPSKSVTRSRRKLFTPRPEPLEESLINSGDSIERVRVPRPSYHRPRARRKL